MRSAFDRRSRVVSAGFLAIFFLFLPARAVAQGGEPPYFAIRGARVVPVSGPVLENATVVVAKGIIVAVGKDAAIPAEAWVIDGKGLTVYPGLFDAFTDIGIVGGSDSAQKKPPARGPEDRPASTPWRVGADEVNLSDKRIENWRNAGFTTVVSAPKGGIFPGQGSVLDLAGERPGELVVKSPVAIPVSLTPPSGFAGFPDSLMGVLGYVHQVWLDTDWSTKSLAIYDKNPAGIERPRYDRTEAALSDALDDHAIVLIPANNPVQLRRALDLAERWKVTSAIYGGQAGYQVAPEIAAKKIPVLVDLKWPEGQKDGDPEEIPTLRELEFRDKAPSTPATFAKSGVKFAFYSGGISSPAEIVKAAKKSVDAGLSSDAAVRALTLSAAEIFGVADRLGSLDKGKIANLVVTDGDLFAEKTKIKFVFVDGQRFDIHATETPKEAPKGDATGKWKLVFTSPDGPEEATADLMMASDGTITGTVTGKRGKGTIFNGTVSSDKFSFTINIPIEGGYSDVDFSGTFEKSAMKGVIHVQSYSIDFTGTKQESAPPAAKPSFTLGGAR